MRFPEAVTAALAASEYAAYFIDDIDHYRTPDGEFYRYDLESVLGDVKVDIAPDGTLTVVQPGSGKPGQGNGQMVPRRSPTHRDEVSGSTHGRVRLRRRFAGGGDLAREPREKGLLQRPQRGVRTEWDIRRHELPQTVVEAIAASQWGVVRDRRHRVRTDPGRRILPRGAGARRSGGGTAHRLRRYDSLNARER